MSRDKQVTIVFQVEAADRSVGIMAEGFSAWVADGDAWCEAFMPSVQDEPWTFEWTDNETGGTVLRPRDDGLLVEQLLRRYAEAYYERESEMDDDRTFEIVRFYAASDKPSEVVSSGHTLAEVKEHCNSWQSSSKTCTTPEGKAWTKAHGDWFDGWREE